MKDLAEGENQADGSLSLMRRSFHKDVVEWKIRIHVNERTVESILRSI